MNAKGWIHGWRMPPLRRGPQDFGARREDPTPTIHGRGGEPLGPMVSSTPAGMFVTNPAPPPPPPRMVQCRAVTSFCIGDGVDAQPGQLVTLPAWRADALARTGTVTIEPNAGDAAMVRAEKEAAVQHRLQAAAAIAAGPAPAALWPPVRRDSYGVEIPSAPEQTVRVRALRSFCVSEGRDCAAGDVLDLELRRALGLVARGFAVEVPGAQA